MKQYYRERCGKPFRDTLVGELCGNSSGAMIPESDADIVLSWLPDDSREKCRHNPRR